MSSDADKICNHLLKCRSRRILRNRIGNLPYSCQRVETALLLASAACNGTCVITKDFSLFPNDYHLGFHTQKSKPCRDGFRNYRGNRSVIFVTFCNAIDAFLKSVMRETHNHVREQLPYCIVSTVRQELPGYSNISPFDTISKTRSETAKKFG